MKYLFSVWMLINCVLAMDFGVRFALMKEKSHYENRLSSIFCFASALSNGGFAALLIQTDMEKAHLCRCVGVAGIFLYLIAAQILVCAVSGISRFWRYLFNGIAGMGIFVYFLAIRKSAAVYSLTENGMTYSFQSGAGNYIYALYFVVVSIDIFAVNLYMLRRKKKWIQAFGKKCMLVEALIFAGMLVDRMFMRFGFAVIPGSSVLQLLGIGVLYSAVRQVNRSRINVANMSEFIYYSLAMPVLIYDEDGRIEIINDAAAAFFDVSQDTLKMQNISISELFDIDEEDVFAFDGKRRDMDVICRKNRMYCSLAVNKIYDYYGDIIGYIIIVTDLSERMKVMQELEEAVKAADDANQAKSTFLANMSHEIRTPMNVIVGFSELLLKMDINQQVREYIVDIKDSSENLLAIINDLLDISKIESGKMELVCTEYHMKNLFQDVYVMINAQAKKKGLEFSMSVAPDMPNKLYGDKIRIRGVLINLLNNAVKYTKEGKVTLEANIREKRDDSVMLEFKVRDTGVGIKPEEKDRLFESFSQVDRKVHYGVEGTGLGLSIVKGYVTLMNGDVTVESVYGEGSVFTAVIEQKIVDASPLNRFQGEENQTGDDFCIGSIRMPGVRVLVVDDNQINLKVAGSSLGYYGLTVDTASGGMEAIELCRKNRYQIVFMDQMMPQMDGVQAMKEIRRLDSYYDFGGGCTFIVLTANAVSGVRDRLLAEGFDEYLGKPMNFKQLERLFVRFIPEEQIWNNMDVETAGTGETDEERKQREIQEMLPQLEIQDGVMFCGGHLKEYLGVLQLVYQKGDKQMEELRKLQQQGNYADYTIQIHSLKGSMRSIGANKLADMAKEQETAGKKGDYACIDAGMEEFCQAFCLLLGQLQPVLDYYGLLESVTEEEPESGMTGEQEIMQLWKDILACMDAYDFAGAAKRVREADREKLPEQYRQDYEQISRWMEDMEEDKIRELIAGYLE